MDEKTLNFIEKAKKVHGNKYDYSEAKYTRQNDKIIIICSEHKQFKQNPKEHLRGNGCSKCAGVFRYNTETWCEKATGIHKGRYDYSEVNYKNGITKVIIICSEHGKFEQKPEVHLMGCGCPTCGGSHIYNTDEWCKKMIKIHKGEYDYSKVEYKNEKTKVTIICKKHGEFQQKPNNHTYFGCHQCGRDRIREFNELNALTLDEFLEKATKIHGSKYDYSKVKYKNTKTLVNIICKDKDHGDFWQSPAAHLQGHNCSRCAGCYSYTTEEWINLAKAVHSDKYDYSKTIYRDNKTEVIIICSKHGEFQQIPTSHVINKYGCKLCSYEIISKKNCLTRDEVIEQAIKVHGNKYDYSKVIYVKKILPVEIICPKHKSFFLDFHHHIGQKTGCFKCLFCPSCSLWKTNGKLCDYCKPKNKNKLYAKTKEMAVVKYLRKNLPDNEFIHNKSVGSECNDTRLFPDIRFDCLWYQLIVEVD